MSEQSNPENPRIIDDKQEVSPFGVLFKERVDASLDGEGTTTSATVSVPEGTDPYDSD